MHDYNITERGVALQEAEHAIILLHGRGASAEDILPLAKEFSIKNCYLAAPQATHSTWYPTSFMAEEEANEPWLSSAVDVVKRLIDETAEHIPLNKIYVMGFSQGACLTLEVATRYANEYGGIVAFTGGLIGKELKTERYNGNFNGTKVFIGSGDKDPHVPLSRIKESKEILEKMGASVQMEIYPDRPHTITMDEINKVNKLLF
ncbi:dienelactone hydrolase family protein [Zunongwangia sp. F260]|uniref:Dienelactone hydrolase family protein n=1 Tax=Autumnicola lenta TaxID=3075593 RepID=A0ABU3CN81_9FLAO|nr:dienelactone hydrolase family protein [Zunongwangia sp. F260]MDT0647810.1 dienelactone hydrolase family protein [Zunongwangia sp. F260]